MSFKEVAGAVIMVIGGILLLRSYLLNRRHSQKDMLTRIDERASYILTLQLALIGAILFSS